MFILNLKIVGAEGQLALFFNEHAKAVHTRDHLYAHDPHTSVVLSDDHGQSAQLFSRDVQYAMIVDIKKALKQQSDMAMLQQAAQSELQKRAGIMAGLGGGIQLARN